MLVKCVSMKNPWGMLVALNEKGFETRSWTTAYRGPLYIHISSRYDRVDRMLETEKYFYQALYPFRLHDNLIEYCGLIVARVELTDILHIREDGLYSMGRDYKKVLPLPIGKERAFGDYSPGRYAWKFDNIRCLQTPIPAKGKLSIWEYDMPANIA